MHPNPSLNQTQSFLMRRFAEVGIRPKTRHGQNFLIDLNLLRVLVDAAQLEPCDVVLEVGTGTGSLTVQGIPTTPTSITFSVSSGQLTINWPAGYAGWILQSQTNTLSVGLGTNWADVPGSAGVTSESMPINAANPAVFYRLRSPTP